MRTNMLLLLTIISLVANHFGQALAQSNRPEPVSVESAASHVELLYFYATWCGPCQKMSPTIAGLEGGKIAVRRIDVDQERELVKRFQIETIPTCVLIAQGEEVDRLIGVAEGAYFHSRIAQVIDNRSSREANTGQPPHDNFRGLPPSGDPQEDPNVPQDSIFEYGRQDAEFEREAKQLANRLRTASKVERTQLLRSLEALNDRHFEHRQSRRRAEIDQLANRVDSLKQLLKRRQSNKKDVLQRRLNELTDPNADLNWRDDQAVVSPIQVRDRNPHRMDRADSVPLPPLVHDKPRPSNRTRPTYQGENLLGWLTILETERSPQKLTDAAKAIQYLNADAEPDVVLETLMRMIRARPERNRLQNAEHDLALQTVELLGMISAEPCVTALIEELQRPSVPNQTFQTTFRIFVSCVSNAREGHSGDHRFRFENASPETTERMRLQLRQRSRAIIRLLVNIAEREPSTSDWAVSCAAIVVRLSHQRVTDYPELVPLARRVFQDLKSDERAMAAELLATAGIDSSEVLQFCMKDIDQISLNDAVGQERWARRVSLLVPHQPEIVAQFVERLANRSIGSDSREKGNLLRALLSELGHRGAIATPILPTLREIAKGKELREDLRTSASEAIKLIEQPLTSIDEDPLPDENRPATGALSESTSPVQSRRFDPVRVEEQTYDGIGYREWLRLLETERKPEKLATAITATARLADENDTARIIHGVIHAAMLVDAVDEGGSSPVWLACFEAVKRLPPEQVVDELLKTLGDSNPIKLDRTFPLMILIYARSPDLDVAIKNHASELIAQLVRLTSRVPQRSDMIGAAASHVWNLSDRPLSDFDQRDGESLRDTIVRALKNGPNVAELSMPGYATDFWFEIVKVGTRNAADLPDLALTLLMHTKRLPNLFESIGGMAAHAECAVPDLVEMFLSDWKKIESADPPMSGKIEAEYARCTQIVRTLGRIGVGEKGLQLLRELRLTEPSNKSRPITRSRSGIEQKLNHELHEALKASSRNAPPAEPPVLNDLSLIRGDWTVTSARSFLPIDASICALQDWRIVLFGKQSENLSLTGDDSASGKASRFEIDSSTTPKTISVFGPSTRTLRRGIYELTETTLKIELADIDEPAPVKFTTPDTDLPKRHTRLELEREFTLPE